MMQRLVLGQRRMNHRVVLRMGSAPTTTTTTTTTTGRRMTRAFSTPPSHDQPITSSFSSSWQNVDAAASSRRPEQLDCHDDDGSLSHDGNVKKVQQQVVVAAPDPIAYLNGFDAVPQVQQVYKKALLNACDLRVGDQMLDVGCGTATHIPEYAQKCGPSGRIHAIDISHEMIQQAQQQQQQAHGGDPLENVSFQVADAYALPFASKSYDVVKEDRVLQHLTRPLEAVQELLRVTKPGGALVLSNPDFRSFQLDAMHPMYTGEKRRPPPPSSPRGLDDFDDLSRLTTKVLNGVIPTLCRHPSVGLSQARLLRQAGARDVEVQILPVPLMGRKNLEAIVPITYMANLSMANGAISQEEMDLWLERLDWEGNGQEETETGGMDLFGVLNFYICRGVKPVGDDGSSTGHQHAVVPRVRPCIGTKMYEQEPPPKPQQDVKVRFVTLSDSAELIEEAMDIINNEYGQSDTGTTLSSQRLRPKDVQEMVSKGELMIAQDEEEESGKLVGCIQVQVKKATAQEGGGLPNFGSDQELDTGGSIGEFTCLAVRSNITSHVMNANTLDVSVQRSPAAAAGSDTNKRGRGIGAALVRAAEAHCRQNGCARMQLGIVCPVESEPAYKQWLQGYYIKLGYTYRSTLYLDYEVDEASGKVVVDQLHDMYDVLHQLVPCKVILFDKSI